MKRPLVWGFLALGFSISLVFYKAAFVFMFFLPILLLPLPLLFKKIKMSQIIFVLFLYCFGSGISLFQMNDIKTITPFYGDAVTVLGEVVEMPVEKEEAFVFKLKTKMIQRGDLKIKKSLGLSVRLPKTAKPLRPGDQVSLTGEVLKGSESRNPGGFNYFLQLQSKGMSGILHAKSVNKIGKRDSFYFRILEIREQLEAACEQYLSKDTADLLKGIIFGDKNIDPSLKLAFQNAGVAHVLSVSGLHVGIIFVLLRLFLTFFHIKKKYWFWFLIPSLIFYTALTSFSISVIRSAIMLLCLVLGEGLHREKDGLSYLSLAGIIILCFWPSQLFQAGFQLSFSAVLGILLFYEPLLFQYKKNFRGKGIKQEEKNPGVMLQGIVLSLCTLLGTAPIMLYHFKTLSFLSFLSNLLIVPMIGIFLSMGILFLILSCFSPLASSIAVFLNLLGMAISLMIRGIEHLGEVVGFLKINHGMLSASALALLILFAFIISGYFYLRALKIKIAITVLSCFLLGILFISPLLQKNLVITFLDVGQGDSVLIETPKGSRYLIDGGGYYKEGSRKISETVLLPALYSKNITKLTGIFLTHNHQDHAQGIEELMEAKFSVDHLFMSIKTNNEALLKQKDIPISLLKKGSRIEGSDGVNLEILSPEGEVKPVKEEEQNNASLVIALSYGSTKILFCGDIEKETEERIVAAEKKKNQSSEFQVIKIPHHGSNTSSTEEFLKIMAPKIAVISVGARNSFGHPREEVLERLKNQGSKILRTDQNGAIEMTSDGKRFWVQTKIFKEENK